MPGQAAGGNPGFIAPMLATAAARLPADAAEFMAEVKWDGLRACIAVAGGRLRAWFRGGRDITAVYPELGALAAVTGRRSMVLDGEIVALSGPRPDFTVLQRRTRASRPGAALLAAVPVTLIIFDVLQSGREDLTGRPYVLRRALLEDLGLQVPVPGRRLGYAGPLPGPCASPGKNRPNPAGRISNWTTIFNELTWPTATARALTGPGDEERSGKDKPHTHPSRGLRARGSPCPRLRSGRWITRFS